MRNNKSTEKQKKVRVWVRKNRKEKVGGTMQSIFKKKAMSSHPLAKCECAHRRPSAESGRICPNACQKRKDRKSWLGKTNVTGA
jgi:hypothetical protein